MALDENVHIAMLRRLNGVLSTCEVSGMWRWRQETRLLLAWIIVGYVGNLVAAPLLAIPCGGEGQSLCGLVSTVVFIIWISGAVVLGWLWYSGRGYRI